MTLRDLFAYGPWQLVAVYWWSSGGLLTAAWLSSPAFRIAAVTSPIVCGLVCAAILGMGAAIAMAPFIHGGPWGATLVGASLLIGGAVGVAASNSFFAPRLMQGCDGTPSIAGAESAMGYCASIALPLLALFLWCRWGYSGLRGVGREPDSRRIANFSRDFLIGLPLRLVITAIVIGTAAAIVRLTVIVPANASAETVLERLRGSDAAAIVAMRSPSQIAKIDTLRERRFAEAQERLARFDFDGARPLIRDAACTLLLPGHTPATELSEAETAFERLDSELDNGFATWRPSAVSGRTLLALLPVGRTASGAPHLPLLWSSLAPDVGDLFTASASTARVDATYRREKVMEAWVVTLHGSARATNAAVAIKLLGASGVDAGLADLLSRRLGREPSGGIGSTTSGAMCAMWDFGTMRIRLGPAVTPDDPSPTPDSPIWLTYYDTRFFRSSHNVPPQLAATYGCDAQLQSH